MVAMIDTVTAGKGIVCPCSLRGKKLKRVAEIEKIKYSNFAGYTGVLDWLHISGLYIPGAAHAARFLYGSDY